ncbi:hypothetical protein D3C86_1151280 [compost metagenome]
MAGDNAAAAVGIEPLHVEAGAVVLGLVDIGKEAGIVDDRPVDRGAVLQGVTHLPPAQSKDDPWMQQVVERRTGGHVTVVLLVPVA